jgi:hypothetical protein
LSWYLTIRGAPDYSLYVVTTKLIEYLATIPELRQTGLSEFQSNDSQPWVCVIVANCDRNGNYFVGENLPPYVNVIELICSYSGNAEWYEKLAKQIAGLLGWSAFDDHECRQI